eukprot:1158518-Pelagomonas_calceolata.AAC.5
MAGMGAEHFYPYKGVDASGDMDGEVERWVAGLWVPLMRAVANVKVWSGPEFKKGRRLSMQMACVMRGSPMLRTVESGESGGK